ncbi:Hypothetical predicted protein [Mytilus galloprovincialis]|uniref:Uncharacterized protein n=1 Tax=Mytilus galloprovincialis TaxID=29158 RepID=A0A8B6HL15_MYTGA|nr:Hypothetical predicted protein [Mytilus galloprovincialis]
MAINASACSHEDEPRGRCLINVYREAYIVHFQTHRSILLLVDHHSFGYHRKGSPPAVVSSVGKPFLWVSQERWSTSSSIERCVGKPFLRVSEEMWSTSSSIERCVGKPFLWVSEEMWSTSSSIERYVGKPFLRCLINVYREAYIVHFQTHRSILLLVDHHSCGYHRKGGPPAVVSSVGKPFLWVSQERWSTSSSIERCVGKPFLWVSEEMWSTSSSIERCVGKPFLWVSEEMGSTSSSIERYVGKPFLWVSQERWSTSSSIERCVGKCTIYATICMTSCR